MRFWHISRTTNSGRFLSLTQLSRNSRVIERYGPFRKRRGALASRAIGQLRAVVVFAQRAALEWRPFRSPRVATRDYFCGRRWTAARTCNTPYRNAHNPRHCDTAPRPPNTARLLDPYADECRRCVIPRRSHCRCIRFKTKTILQSMFTLVFSQAAQRAVSKLSSTCVIARR